MGFFSSNFNFAILLNFYLLCSGEDWVLFFFRLSLPLLLLAIILHLFIIYFPKSHHMHELLICIPASSTSTSTSPVPLSPSCMSIYIASLRVLCKTEAAQWHLRVFSSCSVLLMPPQWHLCGLVLSVLRFRTEMSGAVVTSSCGFLVKPTRKEEMQDLIWSDILGQAAH